METKDWVMGIGIFATLIATCLNFFANRRNRYITAVTAERTKWLGQLRENIATFTTLVYGLWSTVNDKFPSLSQDEKKKEAKKYLLDIFKVNTLITLMLNPAKSDSQKDKEAKIIEATDNLSEEATKLSIITLASDSTSASEDHDKMVNIEKKLIEITKELLKEEWEKIKKEANAKF